MEDNLPDTSVIKPKPKTVKSGKKFLSAPDKGDMEQLFIIGAVLVVGLAFNAYGPKLYNSVFSGVAASTSDRTYSGSGSLTLHPNGTCNISCPFTYYHGVVIPGDILGKWSESDSSIIVTFTFQGTEQQVSYNKTNNGAMLDGASDPMPNLLLRK